MINERRKAMARVYECRKSECLPISGRDALNCIVEQKGEYHSIVPLTGQIKARRDKYC